MITCSDPKPATKLLAPSCHRFISMIPIATLETCTLEPSPDHRVHSLPLTPKMQDEIVRRRAAVIEPIKSHAQYVVLQTLEDDKERDVATYNEFRELLYLNTGYLLPDRDANPNGWKSELKNWHPSPKLPKGQPASKSDSGSASPNAFNHSSTLEGAAAADDPYGVPGPSWPGSFHNTTSGA